MLSQKVKKSSCGFFYAIDLTFQKYSAEEWDHIRKRFYNSILNETEIAKLGQNVGISWPFKGSDEALAFDDPFGDMVATVETESQEDDTFKRILSKLSIHGDYPAEFLHFSKDTEQLLKAEEVTTLMDCVHFGQNLARNVVIGGDLKSFLNSLAHKDEKLMATHMPYRRGEKGLHLAEAIGLLCEDLNEATKLHLLEAADTALNDEEKRILSASSRLEIEASLKTALDKLDKLAKWFSSEVPDIEQAFTTGGSPARFFISINEPRRERMAVELSRLKFAPGEERKSCFFGRIFGR